MKHFYASYPEVPRPSVEYLVGGFLELTVKWRLLSQPLLCEIHDPRDIGHDKVHFHLPTPP